MTPSTRTVIMTAEEVPVVLRHSYYLGREKYEALMSLMSGAMENAENCFVRPPGS
ncbi:hypothetical protein SATRM34S_04615 [Streptomyces atroolivaceus]